MRWLGSQLQMKLKPWDLKNVEFWTKGKQELYLFKKSSIKPIKARMKNGWGKLTLNRFGKIGELKVSLKKCVIQTPDKKQIQLNKIRVALSSNLPNKPETRAHQVPLFHLNTEFSGLILPRMAFPSLEKKISELRLSADFLGVAEGKPLKDYLSTSCNLFIVPSDPRVINNFQEEVSLRGKTSAKTLLKKLIKPDYIIYPKIIFTS